ncbi:Retrovirus-related Pol polyprotein from transposon TNT 1-94 [Senna tora]|uniref:Retrovirus-related Pol polyprotein from transposon TNT 1-94 n=1 Tax=Senna tora TaxID=362788 RepID=A0A835CK97_9FABA|nr:Retrovirus-related Pol polyprotein from transposon TNT 1-94 [Senna tora]
MASTPDASANNGSVPANVPAPANLPVSIPILRQFPDSMHSPRPNLLLTLLKLRRTFGFKPISVYKEAKTIWELLILKHSVEDAGKQKFVEGNYYKWEMTDDKDIKSQINEYQRLLEDLKAEKINFLDEFVAGILIEKLLDSWSDYKQQLKHKQKQLSLTDLITHIIIEDTNRKMIRIAKGKELTAKANLVESRNKMYDSSIKNNKKTDYKPSSSNPKFKKKSNCFVKTFIIEEEVNGFCYAFVREKKIRKRKGRGMGKWTFGGGLLDILDPGQRIRACYNCRIDTYRRQFGSNMAIELLNLPVQIVPLLEQIGFYGVARVGYIQYDHALILALVERWRPETLSFHMPMGECSITLQDVSIHVVRVVPSIVGGGTAC